MKTSTPLLAACALLLSLGPSAQPPEPSKAGPNCQNSCVVTVILAAGCGSGIRVAPDPITVPRGNSTTITWNIVPASPTGWKFPADGVWIQGFETYAKNQFKLQKSGDHTFTAMHENKGPAAFKYDINLVKGTGAAAEHCKLDPTILDW